MSHLLLKAANATNSADTPFLGFEMERFWKGGFSGAVGGNTIMGFLCFLITTFPPHSAMGTRRFQYTTGSLASRVPSRLLLYQPDSAPSQLTCKGQFQSSRLCIALASEGLSGFSVSAICC